MTTPNPYGAPAPGAYPPPGAPQGAPAAWSAPSSAAPSSPGPGAHAAAPQAPAPMPGEPAPLGRRVAAVVIDAAVVVAAYLVLALTAWLLARALGYLVVVAMGVFVVVLALAWFFVYSLMQGGYGSIGMRLMKLRLVRLGDGAPLGFGGALLRNVIWGLAAVIVVGYFSVLFDRTGRHQGWHDKVANAFMRDARADAPQGSPRSASASAGAVAPAAPPAPASPVAPAYGGSLASQPAYAGDIPPRPPLPPQPAAAPAQPAPAQPAPAPAAPAAQQPAPPAAAPAGGDGLIAYVPGITQDPPAGAAPAAPAPADDDIDGDTILVRPTPTPAEPEPEPDLEDTRLVNRTRPAVLEWDDGTRHTVRARSLFGRNPAAGEGAEVVVVHDETLSLSKTHFEIDVTSDGVFVVDHHSTNGVTIAREGERIAAEPGERVALQPGDALEIGDRIVTFQGRG